MNKIYDWVGNEVKVGMTIYFVKTKPGIIESSRIGIMFTDANGFCHQTWEPEENWLERKNKDVWELGEPLEVVWQQGRLCVLMRFNNTPEIEQVIFPIVPMLGEPPIIAIKGLSDNKIEHQLKNTQE